MPSGYVVRPFLLYFMTITISQVTRGQSLSIPEPFVIARRTISPTQIASRLRLSGLLSESPDGTLRQRKTHDKTGTGIFGTGFAASKALG